MGQAEKKWNLLRSSMKCWQTHTKRTKRHKKRSLLTKSREKWKIININNCIVGADEPISFVSAAATSLSMNNAKQWSFSPCSIKKRKCKNIVMEFLSKFELKVPKERAEIPVCESVRCVMGKRENFNFSITSSQMRHDRGDSKSERQRNLFRHLTQLQLFFLSFDLHCIEYSNI